MFGYVIPSKEKLSDEQWQHYRATYCGLCRTLKERYGFCAQFLLNYDFTFLAHLLRGSECKPGARCRRCIAHPICGRDACETDPALDFAADCSVLLVYWKLRDQLEDEKGIRRLFARILLLMLASMFRKAQKNQPELDAKFGGLLDSLHALERENCASLDRTADLFAQIMAAMVPQDKTKEESRVLQQLLYHLGRWIYLIDAWDDLKDDLKQGAYNSVVLRFVLKSDSVPDEFEAAREQMERTLIHSENLTISAFHLNAFGNDAPVVENILCAGLPGVRQLVLSGQWKEIHKRKKQELKRL